MQGRGTPVGTIKVEGEHKNVAYQHLHLQREFHQAPVPPADASRLLNVSPGTL